MMRLLTLVLALSTPVTLAAIKHPEAIYSINQSLALEYDAIAAKNFRLPHQTRETAAEFRDRQISGKPVAAGKVLHTLEPILRLRSITVDSELLLNAATDGFPVRVSLFSDASYVMHLKVHKPKHVEPNSSYTLLKGTLVGSQNRDDITFRIDDDGSVNASFFIDSQRFAISKTPPLNYQFVYERTRLDTKNPFDSLNSVLDETGSHRGKEIALDMASGFAECFAYFRVMQIKAQLDKDDSAFKYWGSAVKFATLMLQATVGKVTAKEMSVQRTKEMLDEIRGEINRTYKLDERYPNQVKACRNRMYPD